MLTRAVLQGEMKTPPSIQELMFESRAAFVERMMNQQQSDNDIQASLRKVARKQKEQPPDTCL